MLTNIRLCIEACKQLNIDWEILHPNQNLLRIKINNNKIYYFVNYSTPFILQSTDKIFKDKEYTYQLLKQRVNLPNTRAFLSPFCNDKYQKYLNFPDIESILESINETFSLPVIIKRNSGAGGNNVFLCQNLEQVKLYLQQIFNINSKNYDYIALAQEYIDISHEYRAVFFNNELLLLYEKNKAEAKFVGNLSPLHWEGAKAVHITETSLISDIKIFVQPIFQEVTLNYAGVDIVRDRNGKYWLIELNSHPSYDIFIRDNSEEIIINLYKKMLNSLLVN